MSKAAKIVIPVILILGIAILALAIIFPAPDSAAYAGGIDIVGSSVTKHFYVDDYPGSYASGPQGSHTFKVVLKYNNQPLTYGVDYVVSDWAQNFTEKNVTTSGSFRFVVTGLGDYAGEFDVSFEYFVILSDPQPKTLSYNGEEQELITAGSAKGSYYRYSLDNVNYENTVPKVKNAGDYTVFYTTFINGTDLHGDINRLNVSVKKAPLTIKSDDQTIAEGSNIMAVSLGYTGFQNGETGDSLEGEIHVRTDYRPGSPAGDYPVSLSGLISVNYDISYNPGTLHVVEFNPVFTAPLPVEGLIYDGTPKALLTPGQIQTEGGYFTYSLEEKGIYSSKIPTATEGDKYTIWYKVNLPGIYCDFPQGHIENEINKVKYDMSGVRFEGLSVAFDGLEHSLAVEGELPPGIEVIYENNSQSHPGRYIVTASFIGETSYDKIEPMTAELIIRATEMTSEIEPGKAPLVMIESQEGFDPEITVHAEMMEKSSFSLYRYETYGQKFAAVYSIKIMKGDTILQPEDLAAGGIKVKILIPNGFESDSLISVLNAYAKNDIEEISFDETALSGRYYTIDTNRLNEIVIVVHGNAFCYWHYILAACIIVYSVFFFLGFIKYRRRKLGYGYILTGILFFGVSVASYFMAGHFCYYCLALAILLDLLVIGSLIAVAAAQKKDKKEAQSKSTFSDIEDIDFYRLIAKETSSGLITFNGKETKEDLEIITPEKIEDDEDLLDSLFSDDELFSDDIFDDIYSKDEDSEPVIKEEPVITSGNTESAAITAEEEPATDAKEEQTITITAEEKAPVVINEEETAVISEGSTSESDSSGGINLSLVPDTEEITDEIEDDDEFLESEIIDEKGNKVVIKYLKSYKAKLILSKDRTKHFYNILKNEILSYKNVKARISWPAEKFRFGRNTIIMFKMTGGELTAYFDLDPKAYSESEYLVEDVSEIKTYAATPAMCKIVAQRRLENAMKLIEAVMEKHGIKKEPSFRFDYTIGLKNRELGQLIEEGLVKETKATQEDMSPVMTAKLKTNPEKETEIKK